MELNATGPAAGAGAGAAARQPLRDEPDERGDDRLGSRPVRDVLAGEGGLVHGRAQVAGIDRPDGEPGELVFTTLTKEGMPLIRYRTRDLTRLLPGTARTMRRMERVKGRSDDMLIVRGVNVFPSQIEAALSGEEKLAPHYVLELRRSGRLDELDVVVETRQLLGSEATGERETLRLRAEHLIKASVGVTSRVRIVDPGAIERSQGKAKRVLDLRPKD